MKKRKHTHTYIYVKGLTIFKDDLDTYSNQIIQIRIGLQVTPLVLERKKSKEDG